MDPREKGPVTVREAWCERLGDFLQRVGLGELPRGDHIVIERGHRGEYPVDRFRRQQARGVAVMGRRERESQTLHEVRTGECSQVGQQVQGMGGLQLRPGEA